MGHSRVINPMFGWRDWGRDEERRREDDQNILNFSIFQPPSLSTLLSLYLHSPDITNIP